MGRVITVFGIIFVLLLLQACTLELFPPVSKSTIKLYGKAVWADDDSALLVCWTEAELITGGFMSQSHLADKKTHVEIWNPDGSLQKVVGIYPEDRWRSPLSFHCGWSVPLYFMKRAGYVIVDDAQISLVDGALHAIAVPRNELNPFGTALPSPDGAVIAVRSFPIGGGSPYVTFFNAGNLAMTGGPHLLPWNALIAWSSEGQLIIAENTPNAYLKRPPDQSDKAYSIDVNGRLKPIDGTQRFRPVTSSSPVSSTGKLVLLSSGGQLNTYGTLYPPFGATASWKRNPATTPKVRVKLEGGSMKLIKGGTYTMGRPGDMVLPRFNGYLIKSDNTLGGSKCKSEESTVRNTNRKPFSLFSNLIFH